MQQSDLPTKFPIPFANGGVRDAIPTTSQISVTPGKASLIDGFPPLTFMALGAGGVPPWGADFNGILFEDTAWARWQAAGGSVAWDSAFSAAIGGYPKGAVVLATSGNSWWLSEVDNNPTNPDTGGANWRPLEYAAVYAGNPNTNVAGNADAPSLVFDTVSRVLWVCTTSGNAAGAVWTVAKPVRGLRQLSGTIIVGPGDLNTTFVGTGTLTLPVTTSFLPGFNFTVFALGGAISLNATAPDVFNQVAGSPNYTFLQNTSGTVQADSVAGSWDALFQTSPPSLSPAPQYINSSQTLGPGQYLSDTSAGAFTATLLSGAPNGASLIFYDQPGTWGQNNMIVDPNGATVLGKSGLFYCNVSGEAIMFRYKASANDWRLF